MSKTKKTRPKENDRREMGPDPSANDYDSGAGNWSVRTRVLVSLFIIWHFVAIFSAPMAMQPSSEFSRQVEYVTSPYTTALYMKHGYRFFAPDPGPSHLLVYEVTLPDGTLESGQFPNPRVHMPRLLYHRFFMISEHFWGIGSIETGGSTNAISELQRAETFLRENGFVDQANWLAETIPADERELFSSDRIDQEVARLIAAGKPNTAKRAGRELRADRENLQRALKHRDVWLKGIANYLRNRHGEGTVRIWIREHLIPDYDHVLDGGKLDDEETLLPPRLVYSEDEVVE